MAQAADVFISYSREDKDRVLSVIDEIRNAGVSVWIDQGGIDAATNWGEEIVNAIENCKVLLLMVSENSVGSQNVMREVMLISEKKKHILPVHLTPTAIPATLKYPLAGIQHVEYFRGDPQENLKTILRSLERIGVEIKPREVVATGTPPTMESPSHSMHSSKPEVELERAIAVIPFHNISPDKETDYFSDGLTEELITNLSQLKDIRVVPGTTTMHYKGSQKNVRSIGEELRARYVITGSVRKHQENLRVAAQLIDAQTEAQLWAQTYKGKLEDVFDIQEQVGQEIAESLKLKLSLTEKIGLTKRPTDNVQAYDLYLRGKEYLYQLTKKSVEYSIQLFEKAIELDPRYAAAYGACSNAYGLLYSLFRREEQLKEHAQELGLKALMYDSNSPDAYAALALSYYYRSMYDEAISAGKRAIELNPDSFLPYWLVGRVYFSMGLYEEARELLERSLAMESNFYTTYGDLELTYSALGRADDVALMRTRLLEFLPTYLLKFPDDGRAQIIYASRLAAVGKKEQALAEAKKAMQLSLDDPLMLYNAACVFSLLGEAKLAIESLKGAFKTGYEYADWIKRDSDLDPIRNDPDYIELMKGR